MKNKLWNILAAVLVAVILLVGLTAQFHPELPLKDRILSLVERPGEVFRFVWEKIVPPSEEKQTPADPVPKVETPLDLFDDATQPTNPGPTVITPLTPGVNDLPMDVLEQGND